MFESLGDRLQNAIDKIKGYKIYIGYSDETSDPHLLDRFTKYAEIIKLM